jgi:hypothetical protein
MNLSQNSPSKRNPNLKMKTSLEVLDMICPFKIYLSQNSPSKRNPTLKKKTSLEVLDMICPSQEPTSVGHCHHKKWS